MVGLLVKPLDQVQRGSYVRLEVLPEPVSTLIQNSFKLRLMHCIQNEDIEGDGILFKLVVDGLRLRSVEDVACLADNFGIGVSPVKFGSRFLEDLGTAAQDDNLGCTSFTKVSGNGMADAGRAAADQNRLSRLCQLGSKGRDGLIGLTVYLLFTDYLSMVSQDKR